MRLGALVSYVGPLGATLHGVNVLYCMTTSLAQDGEGLGTLGLHEPKVC